MYNGNGDKQPPVDPETILFALDQLSKTVEVMNKTLARLSGYVKQHMAAQQQGDLDFEQLPHHPGKSGPSGLH